MVIKTQTVLKNYEGGELTLSGVNPNEAIPGTVRNVIIGALNSNLPTEMLSIEDKAKIYRISLKVSSADEVDLSIDEMAFIQTRVGVIWNALVYGRICELFANNPQ